MLEVDLQVPANGEVDKEIKLQAEVTFGDEKVEDANEVMFEIWKDGKKDSSEMIEAKHSSNGIYEITYRFKEDGVYFIQSHVTAKDQHNMPKKQIVIGDPEKEEVTEQHEHDDHAVEESHSNHHEIVDMEFAPTDSVKMNEETTLTTTVTKDDQPITEADVRFEIWYSDSHQHDWVDVKEQSEGTYEGKYTFKEKGTYHVKIHVSNDEGLHEHTEKTVNVQ
nr:FixH family protein [Bacillus sp. FJAT-47783]